MTADVLDKQADYFQEKLSLYSAAATVYHMPNLR